MNHAIFLPRARKDLDEIGLYIAVDSVDAALSFVVLIEEKCQLIADTPHIGRTRDDLAKSLRSFPVDSYLVFYRTVHDGIEVVRILHASRDIPTLC